MKITRTELMNLLAHALEDNPEAPESLIVDAKRGKSKEAISFLIKKRLLVFSQKEILDELKALQEEGELSEKEFTNLKATLLRNNDGKERLMQFLKQRVFVKD